MLRHALLALTVVGCTLLVIAEFMDLNAIQILTVEREGVGVGSNHGYALAIIAVAAGVMALGAWRGSRPAAIAVAVLGIAALVILIVVDLPEVHKEGLFKRNYESARAVADTGFRVEVAGVVVLLFAGVVTAAASLLDRSGR